MGGHIAPAETCQQHRVLRAEVRQAPSAARQYAEPVTLFQLVRASGGGRRAGQRHLTPLVGREEEIAMLVRRWERARQGDGQLVLIVGEPGLGKSRLVEELHTRLRDSPHTWVEWSCSQLLQNTPLHPIAEWGRQRFGGTETAAEQQLADSRSMCTIATKKRFTVEDFRTQLFFVLCEKSFREITLSPL
jgi:hypothetical protein